LLCVTALGCAGAQQPSTLREGPLLQARFRA
jgi:hypothetical protein